MKRFFAILLAAVLLMSMIPTASMAAQTATVIDGWLRLRSAPNFNADTITSYYTGTVVDIISQSGSWYRVKTPDGRTGYMYGKYLTFGSYTPSGKGDAYVTSYNGYGVRLRMGPGTGYRIIRTYDVGTPVTVLQQGSYWCKISINGTTGYMMTKFLNFGSSSAPSYSVIGYATIWSRNGYGVRLRTGPSTSYSKIGTYSVGTTVEILERGAVWDRIRVGSRIGYMMNEFLYYHNTNEITSVTLNTLTPAVGDVMSVQAISPSKATYNSEWYVGGAYVTTSPTYTVKDTDLGKTIQLKAVATGSYSGSAWSPVTNAVIATTQVKGVTINNVAPVVGSVLEATVNPANATVLYSWMAGNETRSGGKTYTVTAADLNKVISVLVTGNGNFNGTASAATAPVRETYAVTAVSITNSTSGTPVVGDTLTAALSPSGVNATYQWYRGDGTASTAISGATAATYKLTADDVGKIISVKAVAVSPYTGEKTAALTEKVAQAPAALAISTATALSAYANEPYTITLQSAGGMAPITWSIDALPAGLALNASTGEITGSVQNTGTYAFKVTAKDVKNQSVTADFSMKVEQREVALAVSTKGLPEGTAGTPYSATLSANKTGATWTATGLPTELALDASTGAISGNPTTAVNAAAVTVTATLGTETASKELTLTIKAAAQESETPALAVSTKGLPEGTAGTPYSATLSANKTGVTWTVTGLPTELALDASTGAISGNPTTAVNAAAVTVTATLGTETASADLTLTIKEAVQPLKITTTGLSAGTAGTLYTAAIQAEGGTAPFSWTLVNPPTGLTVGNDGAISGTLAAGDHAVTVKVTDANGQEATASFTLTINPATRTLTVDGASSTKTVGETVEVTVSLETGRGFTKWTATGVSLADETAKMVSFKMPDNDVTLASETYQLQLAAPDASTIQWSTDGKLITWESVPNADKYLVNRCWFSDGTWTGTVPTDTNSYPFVTPAVNGDRVKIIAVDSSGAFASSPESGISTCNAIPVSESPASEP